MLENLIKKVKMEKAKQNKPIISTKKEQIKNYKNIISNQKKKTNLILDKTNIDLEDHSHQISSKKRTLKLSKYNKQMFSFEGNFKYNYNTEHYFNF